MAKWLMVAGGAIFLVGAALVYAPWLLTWFGKLPGDIRYESAHSRVFIPFTSMLVVSIVLSIVFGFFRRL